MPLTRHARMLTRYSAWANERLYGHLRSTAGAGDLSVGSRVLTDTLGHVLVVDRIWQAHLEGRPHGLRSRTLQHPMTLDELWQEQAVLDAWYVGCADAMTPGAHDEVIRFEFVDGGAGAMSRGDILLHVVNHKTYHRGYAAEMLYQAGLKPPVMDLPVFLRDAPPDLHEAGAAS